MGRPSSLTESKRLELVLALLRKEAPGSELARRYGVSEPTMYRWRDEFLEAGKSALGSKKGSTEAAEIKRLKSELAERNQLIGEYVYANDFLKKRLEGSV